MNDGNGLLQQLFNSLPCRPGRLVAFSPLFIETKTSRWWRSRRYLPRAGCGRARSSENPSVPVYKIYHISITYHFVRFRLGTYGLTQMMLSWSRSYENPDFHFLLNLDFCLFLDPHHLHRWVKCDPKRLICPFGECLRPSPSATRPCASTNFNGNSGQRGCFLHCWETAWGWFMSVFLQW